MIADPLWPKFRDSLGIGYVNRDDAILNCAIHGAKIFLVFRNGNCGLQGR